MNFLQYNQAIRVIKYVVSYMNFLQYNQAIRYKVRGMLYEFDPIHILFQSHSRSSIILYFLICLRLGAKYT